MAPEDRASGSQPAESTVPTEATQEPRRAEETDADPIQDQPAIATDQEGQRATGAEAAKEEVADGSPGHRDRDLPEADEDLGLGSQEQPSIQPEPEQLDSQPASTETVQLDPLVNSPAQDQNVDLEAGQAAQAGSHQAEQQGPESEPEHAHHPYFNFRQIHMFHHHKAPLPPSDHFTPHQKFYIFGLDGVGAMFISGAINFAIAYGMYTTQDTAKNPIRLFQLPNTLAGDAVVTIFLQCIITWMIELVLVSHDLRTGSVQPAGFLPEPTNRLLRWYLLLDDHKLQGRRKRSRPEKWFLFLVKHGLRAAAVGVVAFILLWGPSVGILTAVGRRCGGDWCFEKQWAPQAFKAILGGVHALITTPPMAALWVFRAGWLKKRAAEIESDDASK